MNLRKKKELAAKALDVGKNRIYFNPEALNEIKEAITKQDIKTLYEEGIISIKPISGRKKVVRRKARRGHGKIKMKVKHRKQDYVKMTRKSRKYLKQLKSKIPRETYYELRRKIKMKAFRDIAHFKEYIESYGKDTKKFPEKKREGKAKEQRKVETKVKQTKDTKTRGAKA